MEVKTVRGVFPNVLTGKSMFQKLLTLVETFRSRNGLSAVVIREQWLIFLHIFQRGVVILAIFTTRVPTRQAGRSTMYAAGSTIRGTRGPTPDSLQIVEVIAGSSGRDGRMEEGRIRANLIRSQDWLLFLIRLLFLVMRNVLRASVVVMKVVHVNSTVPRVAARVRLHTARSLQTNGESRLTERRLDRGLRVLACAS
jgi:hypothetical protein